MAVAGSACNAYRVWVDSERLNMVPTTTLRDLCDTVEDACSIVRRGGVATVAGADVDAVRMALRKKEAGQ